VEQRRAILRRKRTKGSLLLPVLVMLMSSIVASEYPENSKIISQLSEYLL
jgi:hypothetical protein